jgi:hypothetical protein
MWQRKAAADGRQTADGRLAEDIKIDRKCQADGQQTLGTGSRQIKGRWPADQRQTASRQRQRTDR